MKTVIIALEDTLTAQQRVARWHCIHTLERQGRNEYINLASQIGYDGTNSAFIFYENQIRRLVNESPYDDRKLEVLRASCTASPVFILRADEKCEYVDSH